MKRRPCKSCPWRVTTDPLQDIPHYDVALHRRLATSCAGDGLVLMSCHHAAEGQESMGSICAGFVLQVGTDSIGLRLAVFTGRLNPDDFEAGGADLHPDFASTLPDGAQP